MTLQSNLESIFENFQGGAVTIGNFDGVHRGHALLVDHLLSQARRCGGPAIVFTFDPHPAALLNPTEAPRPLTWKNRKARLLGSLGVDVVLFYPTDLEFLSISAEEFFDEVLVKRLQIKALVEGENFAFGKDRQGNIDNLSQWTQAAGIELEVVPGLKTANGTIVSSSRIRKLIVNGGLDEANEMLIEPYRIRGMVVHGDARGRTLGFPTANLEAIDTLLPADGAYAARVELASVSSMTDFGKVSQKYYAAVHIGPNVTFNGHTKKVEVHILDFNGDIYSKVLKVDFLKRIRSIEKFDTPDQLIIRLNQDVEFVRSLASQS